VVNSPDKNLMKERKTVSKQVVWNYSSKNNTSFYSTIGSGAQRLPNGNTFVCSMNDGHFFEVEPKDTSIVWEYINPVTRGGIKRIKVDTYPTYNGVFRAYRYIDTHPALKGHDLTPGKTISGYDPNIITPSMLTSTKTTNTYLKPEDILNQNYPNPFTYSTTIEFDLAEPKHVSVIIYDMNGNQVKSLVNNKYTAGNYKLNWDGTNESGTQVSSGMYFYILMTDNVKISKKMIYFK
jgi:hypothetical protein